MDWKPSFFSMQFMGLKAVHFTINQSHFLIVPVIIINHYSTWGFSTETTYFISWYCMVFSGSIMVLSWFYHFLSPHFFVVPAIIMFFLCLLVMFPCFPMNFLIISHGVPMVFHRFYPPQCLHRSCTWVVFLYIINHY